MTRAFPAFPSRSFPNEDGRAFPVFGKEGPPPADIHWSSVVLLMHYEGNSGDQTALDWSDNGFTPTFAGNAQIDDQISKFGGTSLLCDGNGDAVKFNDNDDFSFGASDFTIDVQAYLTVATHGMMVSKYSGASATAEWFFFFNNASSLLQFNAYYGTGANSFLSFAGSWHLNTDTWYSLAVDRVGNTWRIYADGNVVASHSVSRTLKNSTQSLWIGGRNHTSTNYYWNGNIDEVRITKGVGRYDGNHVAQAAAWPDQ